MTKYLIIEGDWNDGDMIYSIKEIDDQTLKDIMPVIEAIKSRKEDYNFFERDEPRNSLGEFSPEDLYVKTGLCSQEQLDLFREYVPYMECGISNGLHTIEKISLLTISEEEILLEKIRGYKIKCDECKKKVNSKYQTPVGGFRLTKLHLIYRKANDPVMIPEEHKIDINVDPEFCSKKCLMAYLNKEISKIMKA